MTRPAGIPELSVVVPVHNKADVLGRVLQAALDQDIDRARFEILVVDDHSTDNSAGVINDFVASHGNLRTVSRQPGPPGAARSRNSGIEAARGAQILLLDADVLVHRHICRDCLAWATDERRVGMVPTVGSSTSRDIWPLLAPAPPAVAAELSSPVWHGVADARQDLERLRAPWMFVWTTAVLASRQLLREINGFDVDLPAKGSEDIELGYRLHQAGASFAMVATESVLHLPHGRDRTAEEATDRAHERHMLAKHRSIEMEMMCAFDAGHAEAALGHLRHLRPCDAFAALWDGLPPHGLELGRTLLFFAQDPALRRWLGPALALDHLRTAGGPDEESLFGLALPFDDLSFDTAVLPDLRGTCPEALICRLLQEGSRVARQVVYLRVEQQEPRPTMLSAADFASFDRPYWERSVRISRHYHDWTAYELATLSHADCVRSCTPVAVSEDRPERLGGR